MDKTAYELLLEQKVAKLEREIHLLQQMKSAEPAERYAGSDITNSIQVNDIKETYNRVISGGYFYNEYMPPEAGLWVRSHHQNAFKYALMIKQSQIINLSEHMILNWAQKILERSIYQIVQTWQEKR